MKKKILPALFGAILIFGILGFYLLRPVEFQKLAEADRISLWSPTEIGSFEIEDPEVISKFIQLLNETDYRRPLRPISEMPEDMLAVIQVMYAGNSQADIILLPSAISSAGDIRYTFFVNADGKQMKACNPGRLCNYVLSFIEEFSEDSSLDY